MSLLAACSSLFLAAFLAATILPLPSEAGLAALLAAGIGPPALLVVVATAGNVLGSVVNWLLGRLAARFRDRPWFPVDARRMQRAEAWFRRWGVWTLLLAWVPVIGDPLTLVAGMLGVRWWAFLILVTIGKASRYVAVVVGMAAWG
ncbi:membrane protein YqaA with SNARE-associated domain [Stella humosa]|uniref:Membrane protein YqaA with SNARE-associated domain n=1 Tax=Stella humosa TaxID=94 RepID=A0A3N1KNA6_9PROT|nr:YqaA family protein [Stella humosa]ROP80837.1 membrane protein YqaA with SNARE-associated domain [Stella humosa]BBK33371.1 membrane protein [Stella humosa]